MIYLIPNFEKERYGGFQNAVKTWWANGLEKNNNNKTKHKTTNVLVIIKNIQRIQWHSCAQEQDWKQVMNGCDVQPRAALH